MRLLPPFLPPSFSSSPSFSLRWGCQCGLDITRLGRHAGRGAKLKTAAETNTSAKMTRLGYVNPPPHFSPLLSHPLSLFPSHSFSLVHSPCLPLSLPECCSLLSSCLSAVFFPPHKNQRGCVCVCSKCPSWVYSGFMKSTKGISSSDSMWVHGFMSTITAVKNNNNTRRYFGEGGPVGAPSNSEWGHFNRGLEAFPLVLGTPYVLPLLTLQQTHPNRSRSPPLISPHKSCS